MKAFEKETLVSYRAMVINRELYAAIEPNEDYSEIKVIITDPDVEPNSLYDGVRGNICYPAYLLQIYYQKEDLTVIAKVYDETTEELITTISFSGLEDSRFPDFR